MCVCVCVCVMKCVKIEYWCVAKVLGLQDRSHPFNVNTRREPISFTGCGFSLSVEAWALGLEPRALHRLFTV